MLREVLPVCICAHPSFSISFSKFMNIPEILLRTIMTSIPWIPWSRSTSILLPNVSWVQVHLLPLLLSCISYIHHFWSFNVLLDYFWVKFFGSISFLITWATVLATAALVALLRSSLHFYIYLFIIIYEMGQIYSKLMINIYSNWIWNYNLKSSWIL